MLLQLHILGLIFRKVRHGTLRRAVTGALLLLFQRLLRGVLLDVLCAGAGKRKHKGSERAGRSSGDPRVGQSPGNPRSPHTSGGDADGSCGHASPGADLLVRFAPTNERGKAGHVTFGGMTAPHGATLERPRALLRGTGRSDARQGHRASSPPAPSSPVGCPGWLPSSKLDGLGKRDACTFFFFLTFCINNIIHFPDSTGLV